MVTSNRLPSTKSFTLYLTIKDDNKSKISHESLQYCFTKDTEYLKHEQISSLIFYEGEVLMKKAEIEYIGNFHIHVKGNKVLTEAYRPLEY